MSLVITILAACGAMFVNDVLGSCLVLAQSVRKYKIAGHLDGLADLSKMLLYGGAAAALAHRGWVGYLGMIPVAGTGNLTTRFSTKYGDRLMEKFATDGLKGLLAGGFGLLFRKGIHRSSHPASPVVAKPKG